MYPRTACCYGPSCNPNCLVGTQRFKPFQKFHSTFFPPEATWQHCRFPHVIFIKGLPQLCINHGSKIIWGCYKLWKKSLWDWDVNRPFLMGFNLFFIWAKFFPWIQCLVLKINGFKQFLGCYINTFSYLRYSGSVLPERLMMYFKYCVECTFWCFDCDSDKQVPDKSSRGYSVERETVACLAEGWRHMNFFHNRILGQPTTVCI